MSYKHLAGRLIETQRSMLGKSAVKIARSVEGVSVEDDGSVTAVTGEGRAVTEALSRRYIEVLGSAAEDRLMGAAREFEDDLVLPPSLGGPDTAADRPAREPAAGGDSTAAGDAASAMSDGGTAVVQSPGGPDEPTDIGGMDDPPEQTRAENVLQEVASIPEPVKVEYTVASSIPEDGTDLGSVYLMPRGDDDWQTPVSVADATADALSTATDLDSDGIDAFVDAIDPERLLATLNDENGETVSFDLESVTVTFHRTGSLAVH